MPILLQDCFLVEETTFVYFIPSGYVAVLIPGWLCVLIVNHSFGWTFFFSKFGHYLLYATLLFTALDKMFEKPFVERLAKLCSRSNI